VATTLVGTEGATPSTTTVACAVELPFTFVAVKVYIVVKTGETTTDPVEVADWLPIPLSMETVLANVVFHESVLDTPGRT
jgi:hypothetical protein